MSLHEGKPNQNHEWKSGVSGKVVTVPLPSALGKASSLVECTWGKDCSPTTHHSPAISTPNKSNNISLVGGRHMATPNEPHGLDNPPLTLGIMPFSFIIAPS